MGIDWARAVERAAELKDQGYSASQIDAVLSEEAAAADHAAQQYGHANAADARSSLQQARGAMNADAASPGQEPTGDPIEEALRAGKAAGRRGSDDAMKGYVDSLFARAAQGDPRVMHDGTVTHEVREKWLGQAHERQVANRDKSNFIPR